MYYVSQVPKPAMSPRIPQFKSQRFTGKHLFAWRNNRILIKKLRTWSKAPRSIRKHYEHRAQLMVQRRRAQYETFLKSLNPAEREVLQRRNFGAPREKTNKPRFMKFVHSTVSRRYRALSDEAREAIRKRAKRLVVRVNPRKIARRRAMEALRPHVAHLKRRHANAVLRQALKKRAVRPWQWLDVTAVPWNQRRATAQAILAKARRENLSLADAINLTAQRAQATVTKSAPSSTPKFKIPERLHVVVSRQAAQARSAR